MVENLEALSMDEVWKEISDRMNANPAPFEGTAVLYSFDLSGEDGGLYGLRLAGGKAETIVGDPGEADCSLALSVGDFKKLISGNLNATAAYMMGKLKVKGSLGYALKLESLLKEYR